MSTSTHTSGDTGMSDKKVVETIYGKYHKFEIAKDDGGVFGSVKFYLRKDGEPFKGSYSSLSSAVQAAKDEG
jgi:hypothetical protein